MLLISVHRSFYVATMSSTNSVLSAKW